MGRKKKFTIPDDPRARELRLVSEANRGRLENVRALLDLGTSPDSQGDFGGLTAIGNASARRHIEVVEELLARGADPNIQDNAGRNALSRCAEGGSIPLARLLLKHGTQFVILPDLGVHAAEIAHICEHDDLATFLMAEINRLLAEEEKN